MTAKTPPEPEFGAGPGGVEVVRLQWPAARDVAARLAEAHTPRLLLVAADATPPPVRDPLEDWVRLPCDEGDIQARLATLRYRARRYSGPPVTDSTGRLTYAGTSIYLSPIDRRLASLLAERFGAAVPDSELVESGWPDGSISTAGLRAHLDRLRYQLRPLGLSVRHVRGEGWALHPTRTPEADPPG